jgi:asparagine N-glycosylation enzyme membrane subunit Stt3
MKVIYKKNPSFILATPTWEEIWRVFLNFGQFLAIENLEKYLILAFLMIFIVIFWLSIASRKKKKKGCVSAF